MRKILAAESYDLTLAKLRGLYSIVGREQIIMINIFMHGDLIIAINSTSINEGPTQAHLQAVESNKCLLISEWFLQFLCITIYQKQILTCKFRWKQNSRKFRWVNKFRLLLFLHFQATSFVTLRFAGTHAME